MPPPLAVIVTAIFVVALFVRDRRANGPTESWAWLPFIWVLLACSREPTPWLGVLGIPTPGGSLEGGSPIDRLVYIVLLALGIVALHRRGVRIGSVLASNLFLTAFLAFCLLSVTWSDYPFVSLKRWIKVLGHPIMALLVLSEPDPKRAICRLFVRSGFILVPVSVLFIKYFPHYGRGFSEWTGEAYNTGITADKNALGVTSLILGYVYLWHLLRTYPTRRIPGRSAELLTTLLLAALNGWLLSIANSKTPLAALILAIAMMLFVGLPWISKHLLLFYITAIGALIATAQMLFDIYGLALRMLGRDATLTDRTLLWADLLKVEIDPLFGAGFESFWLGDRLQAIWKIWNFRPNQAHNGYLETYLNLGSIGLLLLIGLLLAVFLSSCQSAKDDPDWGRFRLGFLLALLVYNWTEAAFKTTHPMFFMLYIIALRMPLNMQPSPPPRIVARARQQGTSADPASISVNALRPSVRPS